MPKKRQSPRTPQERDKSNTLELNYTADRSPDASLADLVVSGRATNAVTTVRFSKLTIGAVGLTECVTALTDAVAAAKRGDLGNAESVLIAQGAALNAIFTACAEHAVAHIGQHLDATERYLRLAFKAQGQCRTTLETLTAVRNRPTVIAQQANIAHGPQQVNNTVMSPSVPLAKATRAPHQQETGRNELLEAHGERMDARAEGTAKASDPAVVPVDARNGSTDRRGQGEVVPER